LREILGTRIAGHRDELTWEDIFSKLKERGLGKVDFVISDGHKGIQAAAGHVFPGSSWQKCHVHFIRAVLRKLPKKQHKEITQMLLRILSLIHADFRNVQMNSKLEGFPGQQILEND